VSLKPSPYDAEIKAMSTEDFRLICSQFAGDEIAKRLDRGDDPHELVRYASELAYKMGYFEAYSSGQCEASYQYAMDALHDSRARRARLDDGPRPSGGLWRRLKAGRPL
jgi:hypothetical protein